MFDNSKNRLHDVFFYGLYMDEAILKQKGVEPRNPRKAEARGYGLRIGKKATLLRSPDSSAHGMVYSLTHEELHSLYGGKGLEEYGAEAILVDVVGGETIAALCCNLLDPPKEGESNEEYASLLRAAMKKLDLPVSFI